jgi:hypothetical protein
VSEGFLGTGNKGYINYKELLNNNEIELKGASNVPAIPNQVSNHQFLFPTKYYWCKSKHLL